MKKLHGSRKQKRAIGLMGIILCIVALQGCVQGKSPSSVLQMILPMGGYATTLASNATLQAGIQIQGGPTFYVSNQPGARNNINVNWAADRGGTYEIRSNAGDCNTGTIVQTGSYTAASAMSYGVSASSSAAGVTAMVICLTAGNQLFERTFYIARDDSAPTATASPGSGAYGASPSIVASCLDTGGAGCGTIAYNVGSNPSIDMDGNVSSGQRYQLPLQPPDPTGASGWSYHFQAVDLAGNKSPVLIQNYVVDSSLPVVISASNLPSTWPNLPATGTFVPRFRTNHAGTAYLQIGGTDCATGTQIGASLSIPTANASTTRSFSPASVDIATYLAPGPNTLRICVQNTLLFWGYTTFILRRDVVLPTVTSAIIAGGAPTVAPDNATILVNTDEPIGLIFDSTRIQNDLVANGTVRTRITDQSYLFKFPVMENVTVDWQINVRDISGNNMTPSLTGTFRTGMLRRQRALATAQTICRDNVTGASVPCAGTGLNGSWPDAPGPLLISPFRFAAGTPAWQHVVAEDLQTGLVWAACGANGISDGTQCIFNPSSGSLHDIARYCDNMSTYGGTGYANRTGWRLPTIGELSTITTFNGYPNLPPASFPITITGSYWTATGFGTTNGYAMALDGSGNSFTPSALSSYYGLCVSDPNPAAIPPTFVDNGDGTVADPLSNITWQKCSAGQTATTCTGAVVLFDYTNAVSYCDSLSLAGRSWRLPTIKELTSIADPGATSAPYIDSVFANSNGVYWSSTLDTRTTPMTLQLAWQSSNGAGAFLSRLVGGASGTVRCVSGP